MEQNLIDFIKKNDGAEKMLFYGMDFPLRCYYFNSGRNTTVSIANKLFFPSGSVPDDG